MYLSYRSHFTTSLLSTSYSMPPQKTGGRTTMECVEFQEDKGAVILPHILISPQI